MQRVAADSTETLRGILRTATRDAHDQLDSAFAGDVLGDPVAYGDFLTMQLGARLPLERWAAQHCPAHLRPPETTQDILEDLLSLGRPISLRGSPLSMPAGADPVGLAWALAGSHLGNRAMLTQLTRSGTDLPTSFLSDMRMAGFWKGLKSVLDRPASADEAGPAIAAARAVFACFTAALPAHPERIAA